MLTSGFTPTLPPPVFDRFELAARQLIFTLLRAGQQKVRLLMCAADAFALFLSSELYGAKDVAQPPSLKRAQT